MVLLRRIVATGQGDRFQFSQVCSLDANRFLTALEGLIEGEFCERVSESVGKWFLKITPAGHAALSAPAAKKKRKAKKKRTAKVPNGFKRKACRKSW